jgi:hypothetical protein
MLTANTANASSTASRRRRRAITPAASSSNPATGPKMTGIHSYGRIVPFMLCAR